MEDLTIQDIIAILKMRRNFFLAVVSCLFLITLFFALKWSNYRSTATVQIEQSYIASNVTNANDAIVELADQRISEIQQKVTSLSSLGEIITKFNLYPGAKDSVPMSILTDTMRKKIKLDFISSTLSNPAAAQKQTAEQLSAIAFTLSFDYTDPQITQQVTDELVTRFLDEDLKQRRTQAQETSSFLATQIKALEDSMAEQEKAIADFRSKNGESGPAALMFNQQAAASNSMAVQNLDSQITANEGTQGALKAQLAVVDPYSRVIADGQLLTTPEVQLKALEAQYSTLTGQYGPDHPDVVKARRQIQALKAQIGPKESSTQLQAQVTDIQTNLAAAEKTLGPDHPDVLSLKTQLKKLQDKLAATPKTDTNLDDIKHDADNPAYIQLSAQLMSAQEQHKALVEQREALVAQQAKYDQTVAANPLIEQEMSKLTRDYDNSQLRYRELKEKKMAADMTEQLELGRKGQRLVVINPPTIPDTTHPPRILLVIGGFVFSLMGGFGSVIVLEFLAQNVHGANHLTSLVGVAPLIAIPHILSDEELKRPSLAIQYLMRAARFLAMGLLVVFTFIMIPLEIVWNKIRQRLKPTKTP